jgi:DNA-directed RNA polymerase specialized sigma24 family protein
MFEVWKGGTSIGTSASVLPTIMRLAYSRAQKHFGESRADAPHSQRDGQDTELSKSLLTTDTPPGLQIFLSNLSIKERAVAHLVYASGCSRRETADIMKIACDCVDVLLRQVRASAKLYFNVTPDMPAFVGPLFP